MSLTWTRETIQLPSLNLAIIAIVIAVNAALYIVLPIYLLPHHRGWILLLLSVVLSTITHWALIHEAIHGKLLTSRVLNDGTGRLLSVLFGTPFEVVRFGHLSHHSLNAKATERPEIFTAEKGRLSRFRLIYYLRLCCGVYAAEILSVLLAWLPRRPLERVVRWIFYEGARDAQAMADRAAKVILHPQNLRAIRVDSLGVIGLITLACWLYGPWWPAFIAALAGRAFIVSFMDNAPHYAGELGDPQQGYDMYLPQPWRMLVLNSNLHGTHHRHPNLPWTALPRAFAADAGHYAGDYWRVPLRQFSGPVTIDHLQATQSNDELPTRGDNPTRRQVAS